MIRTWVAFDTARSRAVYFLSAFIFFLSLSLCSVSFLSFLFFFSLSFGSRFHFSRSCISFLSTRKPTLTCTHSHTQTVNRYIQNRRILYLSSNFFAYGSVSLGFLRYYTYIRERGNKVSNEYYRATLPASVGSVLLNQLQMGLGVNAFDLAGHVHRWYRWLSLSDCERSGWHCNQTKEE